MKYRREKYVRAAWPVRPVRPAIARTVFLRRPRSLATVLAVLLVLVLAAPAQAATGDLVRHLPPAVSGAAAGFAAGTAVPVAVAPAVVAAAPESLWMELEPGEPLLAHRTGFEVGAAGHAVWRGSFADDPPGYTSVTLTLWQGEVLGTIERVGRASYRLDPVAAGRGVLRRLAPGDELQSWSPPVVRSAAAGTATDAPTPPAVHAPASHVSAALATIEVRMLFIATPLAIRDGASRAQAQHSLDDFNTVLANSSIPGRLVLADFVIEDLGLEGSGTLGLLQQRAVESSRAQELKNQREADLVTVVYKSEEEARGCGSANRLLTNSNKDNFGHRAFAFLASWCLRNVESGNVTREYFKLFGADLLPGQAQGGTLPYARAHAVEGEFRTMMSFNVCDCDFLRQQLSDPRVTYKGTPVGIADERDNARAVRENLALVAGFQGTQPAPPPPPPPPANDPPAAPAGLTATAVSTTEVDLSWSDQSDDETGFQVQVQPSGGNWSLVATVPTDTTGHRVTGLEPATLYGFRVRAVNSGGGSAYSNRAEARTEGGSPAAPTGLEAAPGSTTSVVLTFPAVNDAEAYEVEVHGADPADDRTVAVTYTDGGAVVAGLEPGTAYTFRARAGNGHGISEWSDAASAATFAAAGATAPCVGGGETLCLLDERFELTADWRNPRQPFNHGVASALPAPGSQRTGLFTFFNPDNVELVVKMLDGRPLNGSFWVFYGALSDVEYWVTVRDTETGDLTVYHNEPFEICGRGDTTAFTPEVPAEPGSLRHAARLPVPSSGPAAVTAAAEGEGEGTCTPGDDVLCLAGGRFRVEVDWVNPHRAGDSGVGHVYDGVGTDLSGYFWFFREDNLELAVKILDGRALNDHFWIFWGGLSDVGYTIRVTDTVSGDVHEFENPPLTLCGGSETEVL